MRESLSATICRPRSRKNLRHGGTGIAVADLAANNTERRRSAIEIINKNLYFDARKPSNSRHDTRVTPALPFLTMPTRHQMPASVSSIDRHAGVQHNTGVATEATGGIPSRGECRQPESRPAGRSGNRQSKFRAVLRRSGVFGHAIAYGQEHYSSAQKTPPIAINDSLCFVCCSASTIIAAPSGKPPAYRSAR